jgi:uncharacterized protein
MPTALKLTAAEREQYVQALHQRADALEKPLSAVDQQAYDQLLERVRRVAMEIKKQYGARRVILFGSLAHGAWFHPDTDVDLAVEGLEGAAYWKAWGLAEQIIDDRNVDLIDVATASRSLKKAIERYGVEL